MNDKNDTSQLNEKQDQGGLPSPGDTPRQVDTRLEEIPEQLERPIDRWIASFKRGMESQKAQRKSSAKATRDRMKPVFLGLLAVVSVVLIMFGLFSSPMSQKRQQQTAERRTPNLGRPLANDPLITPPGNAERSVTPLLGADIRSQTDPNRGVVTESDLQGLGNSNSQRRVSPMSDPVSLPSPSVAPSAPSPQPHRSNSPGAANGSYDLRQIEFSDAPSSGRESLAEVESRIARLESQAASRQTQANNPPMNESLAKPSLVYVHNPSSGTTSPAVTPVNRDHSPDLFELPTGMRLMARLQTAITTAVRTPVVALVEYNYEKDGAIVVPAGSKVLGQLEQANPSGHVGVKFDTIQMPDGTTFKIEGLAQGLDYGPLKGEVKGKKSGSRFLARALTGVGIGASQVVGLRGGLSGPIDNSVFVRERLANNIAQAGDQQLQQMALSTNIVVTVPANLRFYVVLQKPVKPELNTRGSHQAADLPPPQVDNFTNSTPLSRAELEELRSLKQEFSRLMELAGDKGPAR